jgi:hypothetical protein
MLVSRLLPEARQLMLRWVSDLDKHKNVLPVLLQEDSESLLRLLQRCFPELATCVEHVFAEGCVSTSSSLMFFIAVHAREVQDRRITLLLIMSVCSNSSLWSRVSARLQCPLAYRPLFKAVAKNYPVCGFLSTSFAASAQFQHLLAGQAMNLAVKQQLQESFPALHAVVSRKEWGQIPACFLSLVRVLGAKATAPARVPEVRLWSIIWFLHVEVHLVHSWLPSPQFVTDPRGATGM